MLNSPQFIEERYIINYNGQYGIIDGYFYTNLIIAYIRVNVLSGQHRMS